MKTFLPAARTPPAVLLFLIIGACSSGPDNGSASSTTSPVTQTKTVARVIVTPSSLLLQPSGAAQLTAKAVDADGATVSGLVITWSASSAVVTVGSDGKVTAGGAIDSAVVTASVGTITSAPVTALVARLNAGAQLIADDQVVSDPVLLDTTEEPGVGSQLKMTLSGSIVPAVGTIIVSAGAKPISGKVVSSTANGGNTDIVYEVLPLADVFSELKLEQTYAKSELVQSFDVQPTSTIQHADGTKEYQFALETTEPPSAAVRTAARTKTTRSKATAKKNSLAAANLDTYKWKVGSFECSAKTDLSAAVSFHNIASHVTEDMGPVKATLNVSDGAFAFDISSKGTMHLNIDGEVHLSDALKDTVTCDARLYKYVVVVPPQLGVIFTPVVPVVGLRAKVSGALTVGDAIIGIKSDIDLPVVAGISVSIDGTASSPAPDGNATATFNWTLGASSPTDLIRFSGEASAGLYVQASFTNYFLVAYAFFKSDYDPVKSLVDIFGGLHATVGLATVNAQLQDLTVPSGYVVTLLGEIKPGEAIDSLAELLSSLLKLKKIELPDLKYDLSLFSQPKGTVQVSQRRFVAGDKLQFTVTLDPATVDPAILGVPIISYNVKQVEVWRKTAGGTSEMLGMAAGQAGLAGAPGKHQFKISWTADGAGTTTDSNLTTAPGNFYAVVVPNFGEDFGFRVGPALGWFGITERGGPAIDEGHRVVVDAEGNLIVALIAGEPLSSENRAAVGGYDEIQLYKFDQIGTMLWARNIDGPGDENVTGLTVDAEGNIFLTGRAVNSPLAEGNPGGYGFSGWAASYAADGSQLWLKQWQDGFYSTAEYIALGPNREVYVLGTTSNAAGRVGGDVLTYVCVDSETQTNDPGEDCGDLTLRRLDASSGGLIWSQTDSRAGNQIARGLTVDDGGNIYTATLTGVDTVSQNTGDSTASGYDDFVDKWREPSGNSFVEHDGVGFAMWNDSGEVIWRSDIKNQRQSTVGGFTYSDEYSGGIVASGGSLWAVVRTTGQFPGATSLGGEDSALFRINPSNGESTFVALFGSAGDDVLTLYGPTLAGGLLMTGFTTGAVVGPNAGNSDILVVSLNPDGSTQWIQQFGGPGNDNAMGAAAAPDGSIYVTGYTDGNMPATLSGFPANVVLSITGGGGGEDLFIAKLGSQAATIQSVHPTGLSPR